MYKKNLVLIGGGGHCKSCIDVIEQSNEYEIKGILDPNSKGSLLGYPIINRDDSYIENLVKEDFYFIITLGQIKTAKRRVEIYQLLKENKAKIATIISPSAYVSKHAKVKEGTIIMHHALVNADAMVGNNCIVNTKALIEHDAIVEDNCHISTGAIINGGTVVRKNTFFGSNAMAKEYIEIKANSVIGGGVTLLR